MATRSEKVVTLNIKVPMRSAAQVSFTSCNEHDGLFSDATISRKHLLPLIQKLHTIVSTKTKRFDMIREDKDQPELFSDLTRTFIEGIGNYSNPSLSYYYIRDEIYVCLPRYSFDRFYGLQIHHLEQIEQTDPQLFELLGRYISTLIYTFGYMDMKNYTEFIIEREAIDDNIHMAKDENDTPSIMLYKCAKEQVDDVMNGRHYRRMMKKILSMQPLEKSDVRNYHLRIRNHHSPHSIFGRLCFRLSHILQELEHCIILGPIFQYKISPDFDYGTASQEPPYPIDHNFVILWKYEDELWKLISESIDSYVGNFGLGKVMIRTEIKNSYPSEKKLKFMFSSYNELYGLERMLHYSLMLFNDDRLLKSYTKKSKEYGTDNSPVLHPAKSVHDIVLV